jgi:hypothetical protein
MARSHEISLVWPGLSRANWRTKGEVRPAAWQQTLDARWEIHPAKDRCPRELRWLYRDSMGIIWNYANRFRSLLIRREPAQPHNHLEASWACRSSAVSQDTLLKYVEICWTIPSKAIKRQPTRWWTAHLGIPGSGFRFESCLGWPIHKANSSVTL